MNGQWDVVVQSVIERWKVFLLAGSLRKESFCKHLLHWIYLYSILYCTIKRLTTWVLPPTKCCQVLKAFIWKVHTPLRCLRSWYSALHCKKYVQGWSIHQSLNCSQKYTTINLRYCFHEISKQKIWKIFACYLGKTNIFNRK